MTAKEYEGIKARLNRYREMRGRVARLTEEAARWNSMAELSAPEFRRTGGGRGGHQDMGALKASALTIEAERDQAAKDAMAERQHLLEMISQIEDDSCRSILEQVYIGGATTKSVAAAMGISERTAFRKMNAAFRFLAQKGDL